ncbi:MAG TPA: thiamine pyrophosphate-dependent enzyme [Steroidobacteraceae bacterium]|nr:thiamine pyrophosphate-dependent enzyme [Steroidobacteraceae bacterium]
MDVQRAEAGGAAPAAAPRQAAATPRAAPKLPAAERPLLIAGSGVFYAGQGEALVQFCERCAVPVTVPIWDRGAIDRPIPQFMGVIGAATGGPRLLADADLVLMCGAANDYRVGYLKPPAVRPDACIVSIEPEDLGRLQLAPRPEWLAEAQKRRDEFRRTFESAAKPNPGGIHALDILAALREVMTDETALLIDGGSIGQWIHQLLCDRYPSHWLTCGASGAVGWGLPGAMAARLCYPDRPVILISGDGAMTFTVAELECAARQHLPFVAIVADDQAWGITRTGHQRQFGAPIASDLGPIDFVGLAEALGARGVRVGGAAEVAPAIRGALRGDRPVVIHVPIKGGNDVPHFAA